MTDDREFTNSPELDCELGTQCRNCDYVVGEISEHDHIDHFVCGSCDYVYCQEYYDEPAWCEVCPVRICYNCRSGYKKDYCKLHR